MEWIKAAIIALSAGSVIGAVLAAADVPSPAPEHYLGVVAGAFTLVGMFVGTYVTNHYGAFVDAATGVLASWL